VRTAVACPTRACIDSAICAICAADSRVVEVVSGEPLAAYLERHVFGPLGMNASTTVPDLRDGPDVACGHVGLYGGSVSVVEPLSARADCR
jgi:CubicO group peptidase (beta-lactamase class C family)